MILRETQQRIHIVLRETPHRHDLILRELHRWIPHTLTFSANYTHLCDNAATGHICNDKLSFQESLFLQFILLAQQQALQNQR